MPRRPPSPRAGRRLWEMLTIRERRNDAASIRNRRCDGAACARRLYALTDSAALEGTIRLLTTPRLAAATAAIAAKRTADNNTWRGAKPHDSRYPPNGAAARAPKRPTPSAHATPVVRMRAGYSRPQAALDPIGVPLMVTPVRKQRASIAA